MTGRTFDTDRDVRAWADPWCRAWTALLWKDYFLRRPPSAQRLDEMRLAVQHGLYALTRNSRMPSTSGHFRAALERELWSLWRLLAGRRRDVRAIVVQAWEVADRWMDLALTGARSETGDKYTEWLDD